MVTSPAPLRSIFVKPETFRDSLTTFPEPVVTEQATSIVTVAIRTTEARQRPPMAVPPVRLALDPSSARGTSLVKSSVKGLHMMHLGRRYAKAFGLRSRHGVAADCWMSTPFL